MTESEYSDSDDYTAYEDDERWQTNDAYEEPEEEGTYWEVNGEIFSDEDLRAHYASLNEAETEDTLDRWESIIDTAEGSLGRPLNFRKEAIPLIENLMRNGPDGALEVFRGFDRHLSDDDRVNLMADLMGGGDD